MIDKKQVEEFYDEFSEFQQTIAYNERHFLMFERLLNAGMKGDSNVLELGCGIGIITSLMAKVIKNGKVVSVDLSPKSIEIAKSKTKNVEFVAADITEYKSLDTKFDFITLFDVVEHIPLELQKKMFDNVYEHMGANTQLLINVPNPELIVYGRKHFPERLQIIDQPILPHELLTNASAAGLFMTSFSEYNIWHKKDHHFYTFRKKSEFVEEKVAPPKRSIKQRIRDKFELY